MLVLASCKLGLVFKRDWFKELGFQGDVGKRRGLGVGSLAESLRCVQYFHSHHQLPSMSLSGITALLKLPGLPHLPHGMKVQP